MSSLTLVLPQYGQVCLTREPFLMVNLYWHCQHLNRATFSLGVAGAGEGFVIEETGFI